MGPGETIGLIAVVAAAMAILRPIAGAIGDRLRGGRSAREPDPQLAEEVDHLRARLAEVEERLDFAERLLARGAEADQIQRGAQQ